MDTYEEGKPLYAVYRAGSAMIVKGILKAFNSTLYTATVQVQGSLSVWLEDVPVSRGLPIAEMVTGRNVSVQFHEAGNPDDAVVVAVWT